MKIILVLQTSEVFSASVKILCQENRKKLQSLSVKIGKWDLFLMRIHF